MRDIKFRALTIEDKRWAYGFIYRHDPPLHCFAGESKESPSFAIIKTGFADWNMPRPIDQVEVDGKTVGQYIGLTDKNGKEIYEGDVLMFDERLFKWVVSFEGGSFCGANIGIDGYKSPPFKLSQSDTINREICGNIYENPELLNSEQNVQVSDTTKAE